MCSFGCLLREDYFLAADEPKRFWQLTLLRAGLFFLAHFLPCSER